MSSSFDFGRLLIIGGGKMGEGILAALIASSRVAPDKLIVANPGLEKRLRLSECYGVDCVADACQALPADTVILAVKPQVLPSVLESISSQIAGSLVISVAAGISSSRIESMLPEDCSVVRVMPNMPMLAAAGMSCISPGSRCSDDQVEAVVELFSLMGDAVLIPEVLQDASCAINGSGPAYFAHFLDELSRAGVAAGLDPAIAYRLSLQTMFGTAVVLKEGAMDAAELVTRVSSPGGTTIAALAAMDEAGMPFAVRAAVDAAVLRSKELAQ